MRNFLLFAMTIFVFTLQARSASAKETLTMGSDWIDGVRTDKGLLICDVLKFASSKASVPDVASAKAANHYSIGIPLEDFAKYDVALTTKIGVEQLALYDRGSLWIVYSRDEHKDLDYPVVDARWIWQPDELSAK